MTTPADIEKELSDAYESYRKFGIEKVGPDQANFKDKLSTFLSQFPADTNNPGPALMMFFVCILSSNGTPYGPFKANDASYATNYNDQLTGTAKSLNYASALRDGVTYIKQEFEKCKNTDDPNAIGNIEATIGDMQKFLDSSKFNPNLYPEIFKKGSATFDPEFTKIKDLLNTVKTKYHGSIHQLWVDSQKVGDTTAGAMIQDFTNTTDNLFSDVATQQNVLQTQLQNIEANYKTVMSAVGSGVNVFLSVIKYVMNNSGAK